MADDQRSGIAAQLGEARRIEPASASFRLVGAEPQQRFRAPARAKGQHRRKAGRAGRIAGLEREQFMHSSPRKPAFESRVKSRMPGLKSRLGMAAAKARDPRDFPPHPGKMIHRLAHFCS